MVKHLLAIFILLLVFSCKPKAAAIDVPKESETFVLNGAELDNPENIPYFKASGNEPFWNFTISESGIAFKSLIADFEDFSTPPSKPIQAMDANVKLYKVETESVQLNIQISQNECVNTMSGDVSPYTVALEIKRSTDTQFQKLNGCGSYQTDYRLHDIWVLETLNGTKVALSDFSKELPYLEINSGTNTFMGHAGCNSVRGALFYEKEVLRFTNAATTLMMGMEGNKEDEFLRALQSSTSYTIENNRLHLSNPSGLLLVFKKVD